jgi:hypothetical protein
MRKRFENNFKLICFNTCTVTLSAVILQPLRKLSNENELKKLFFGTVFKQDKQSSLEPEPPATFDKKRVGQRGRNKLDDTIFDINGRRGSKAISERIAGCEKVYLFTTSLKWNSPNNFNDSIKLLTVSSTIQLLLGVAKELYYGEFDPGSG